jgi:hypothetical protein
MSRLRDQKDCKELLRVALQNPHVWNEPELEDGESASARSGTWARTILALRADGISCSNLDLRSANRRQKLAAQLQ